MEDKAWSYKSIDILLLSISNNYGGDFNVFRNMIAAEIAKERTNLRKWTSCNIINISNRLCKANGELVQNAFSKIVSHVFTNIPTLNKWKCYYLNSITNVVCSLKPGSVKTNSFLKIADLVTKSQLSKWQSFSISSIFFSLSDEYMSLNSSIKDKKEYKKALNILIKHMERYDFRFSRWIV